MCKSNGPTNIRRVHVGLNRFLRLIADVPYWTRLEKRHGKTSTHPIDEIGSILTERLEEKCVTSDYPLLRALILIIISICFSFLFEFIFLSFAFLY